VVSNRPVCTEGQPHGLAGAASPGEEPSVLAGPGSGFGRDGWSGENASILGFCVASERPAQFASIGVLVHAPAHDRLYGTHLQFQA
jgi:hypothetical protein